MGHIARIAVFACVAFGVFCGSGAQGSDTPFTADREIRLVVGYPTTSGYSLYARVLSRHLGKQLPGGARVVVQNMPGAASLSAANWLYTVAAKDGTVIGMISGAATIDPLFGSPQAKFDGRRFTWIGNIDQSVGTCIVSYNSEIRSLDDLRLKPARFGGTGPAAGITQGALALKNLFGAKIQVVNGYSGGADIILALERGEVDGQCGVPSSLLKTTLADKVKMKQLLPIIHDGLGEAKDLPGVKSVYDYADDAESRAVLDLVFGWHVLGRPVLAPPDIPLERAAIHRQAFLATMKDHAFTEEAAKAQLDINPMGGTEVEDLVAKLYSHSRSTIEKAAKAIRDN